MIDEQEEIGFVLGVNWANGPQEAGES